MTEKSLKYRNIKAYLDILIKMHSWLCTKTVKASLCFHEKICEKFPKLMIYKFSTNQ